MAGRKANPSGSAAFQVTVSSASEDLLKKLAKKGVYGRSVSEVAARFIDRALEEFVERPQFQLPGTRSSTARKKPGRSR